jgi:hypothetical protein
MATPKLAWAGLVLLPILLVISFVPEVRDTVMEISKIVFEGG